MAGITANEKRISQLLHESLMLVTALNNKIGWAGPRWRDALARLPAAGSKLGLVLWCRCQREDRTPGANPENRSPALAAPLCVWQRCVFTALAHRLLRPPPPSCSASQV